MGKGISRSFRKNSLFRDAALCTSTNRQEAKVMKTTTGIAVIFFLAFLKNGGNIRSAAYRSVVTRKCPAKEEAVRQSGSGSNEEVPLGGHGSCSIGDSGSGPG